MRWRRPRRETDRRMQNAGSCHGAARGKDGFRLSLFGFDPEGDYKRLTTEMIGRRVNLAIPQESLMLEKATGKSSDAKP